MLRCLNATDSDTTLLTGFCEKYRGDDAHRVMAGNDGDFAARPLSPAICGLTSAVLSEGAMPNDDADVARWEHFHHGADIGIRGVGLTRAQAFEQAALALSAVVTAPDQIRAHTSGPININRDGAGDDFLFLDWINALIFEMATRSMLFARFPVVLDESGLSATVWGEPVDVARHCPAVEPKGTTFTELAVRQPCDGIWIAQCVVDV